MGELITKEVLMGAQKVMVGDGTADLILNTLGKVYIKAGGRFKLLDDLIKELSSVTSTASVVSNLTTLQLDADLLTLIYPGDGKFVFIIQSQNLYITVGGNYLPIIAHNEADINWGTLNSTFVLKVGDTMSGILEAYGLTSQHEIITHGQIISDISEAPFVVKSTALVENLNGQYLGDLERKQYAVKAEDERITGQWSFDNQVNFNELTTFKKDLISGDGFASGFAGYGWKMDSKTNTLTVDNLIVRRIMQVYELVVMKIRATNGSLWVADADKIMEVTKLISPVVPTLFVDGRNPNWKNYSYDGNFLCSGYDIDGTRVEFLNGVPIRDINGGVIPPQIGYDSNDDVDLVISLVIPNSANRFLTSYYTGDFYKIIIENPKMYPFRVNDIVRCQKFTGSAIKTYDALVTNIAPDNFIIIRLAVFNIEGLLYEIEPAITDGLVRIGNINNQGRQGAIYLTSSEVNSPYMDVLTEVNRPDFTHPLYDDLGTIIATPKNLKLRLGNLSGIYDPAFGPRQPSGMGLYGENVFLKGNLVQVTAGESVRVPVYRGLWDYTKIYWVNDQVTFNEVIYTCISDILVSIPNTQNPEVDSRWESSVSSLTAELTSPSITLNLDPAGALKAGEIGVSGKSTGFKVFKGTTDVTAQYNITVGSYSGIVLGVSAGKLYVVSATSLVPKTLMVTLTKGGNDVRNLFWNITYSKDGLIGSDGAPGTNGTNGVDGGIGPKGDVGPSLTYEGEWSPTAHYYNRVTMRSVVKRTIGAVITYYITKLSTTTSDIDFGIGLQPETHLVLQWETFAGQFTSVATGLLLAENAIINVAASNVLYIGSTGAAGVGAPGWAANSSGIFSMATDAGGVTPLTILSSNGSFTTQKGTIGGWNIDATSISSPGNLINLNSAGHIDIQSTGYLNIGANISLKGNAISNFGGLKIGTDGTLYAEKAGVRTFEINPAGDFLFNGNFYLSNQAGGTITSNFSDLFDVILNPDGQTVKTLVSKVNFASKGDITAYQVGALDPVSNGVLALLTGVGPIYKPSNTEVGLRYDTNQFQLSGGTTLQIIPSVLIPAVHNQDISTINGLQTALNGKATQANIDTSIAALVNGSPAALDTLNELATALGNDPNFSTTVLNQIGTKLNSSDIYAWAKAAVKPSYTSAEVGALPNRTFGTAANNNTGDFAPSGYGVGGSPVVSTDADNYRLTGDYYFVTPAAHSPQGYFQAHVMGSSNGDFAQIGVGSANESYFRWGTGTWRKVWHDGNFTPANYLPLAGGTLTGALYGTTASFTGSVTATSFTSTQAAGSGAWVLKTANSLTGIYWDGSGVTEYHAPTIMNLCTGNVTRATVNALGLNVVGSVSATQLNSSNAVSWISGTFNSSQGGDRVVIGNLGGAATIGAHNNTLSVWSTLNIQSGGLPTIFGGSVISASIIAPLYTIRNASGVLQWTVSVGTGERLEFKNASGVTEMVLTQAGEIHAKTEINAYSSIV